MRNARLVFVVLGVLASVVAVPRRVAADTIEITGGGLFQVSISSEPQWSNFELDSSDSSFTGHVCCGISATIPPFGGEANLSGGAGLVFDVPTTAPSSNVVNGIPVTAYVSGTLTFTAPNVVLPAPVPGMPWQFSSPFTATGHITGLATPGGPLAPPGPELFSFDLTGSGTATINGVVTDPSEPRYFPQLATYAFAPTPEPTGVWLLLMAGGAAGVWRGLRAMVMRSRRGGGEMIHVPRHTSRSD